MLHSKVPLPAQRSHRVYLGMVALAVLAWLIYFPILNNGLVSDDRFYVSDTSQLADWQGLLDTWFKFGATVQYYPLVHTFLWVQYQLWGEQPVGYHVVGVWVHVLVALLWRLLANLRMPNPWLAAMVFVAHPVQVETVAWASEQKNLFSALFAISAIWSICAWSDHGKVGSLQATTVLFWGVIVLRLCLVLQNRHHHYASCHSGDLMVAER